MISNKSPSATWVSLFSNQKCSFLPGQSIAFARIEGGRSASDHSPLAPAFRLHSYKQGWYLYSGCSKNCSGCRQKQWIPWRRCICLPSSGPCVVLSSTKDECVPWQRCDCGMLVSTCWYGPKICNEATPK